VRHALGFLARRLASVFFLRRAARRLVLVEISAVAVSFDLSRSFNCRKHHYKGSENRND